MSTSSQTSELVSEIEFSYDDIQVICLIINPWLGKNFYSLIMLLKLATVSL